MDMESAAGRVADGRFAIGDEAGGEPQLLRVLAQEEGPVLAADLTLLDIEPDPAIAL